jgi:uncharacterized protein
MKASYLFGLVLSATFAGGSLAERTQAQQSAGANLAVVATASASYVSSDTTVAALNSGYEPRASGDARRGSYGNWDKTGTQWVQYEWSQPISTSNIDVYWWADGRGIHLPAACRLDYWDGQNFVSVSNAAGLDVAGNHYNATTFDEVQTTKLRLEIDANGRNSTGILQWKVYDTGKSPKFPPRVTAGVDRSVVTGGKTYLAGKMRSVGAEGGVAAAVTWGKDSGPGDVVFADASAPVTTATFATPGDYVLKLTATLGDMSSADTLKVNVVEPPPPDRLDVVYTKNYSINNPFWNSRVKALMVNWIPHCIDEINSTNIPQNEGAGGIDNFIEAAKALKGLPHARQKGYVFANAWVHQTVEAMSIALQIEPHGDPEIIAAQKRMHATLQDWIPKILAAQEPDGYLQTAWTLRNTNVWRERWSPQGRANHEGYTAGYFIESAINYTTLTGGKDKRLYNAAKRLADCWYANLGPPPKKPWYDGHEEMEQALVRFGRFVNDLEGQGHGDHYIELAKFLLDCRSTTSGRGEATDYDQSNLPVTEQYEAEGHAVRAMYLYSGMADVAAETHNPDYESAVLSLWNSTINTKYYVTGGVGSLAVNEGFGAPYFLPNNTAYCEACASCGEVFFDYKMNLAYHDAKYADAYEDVIYNALLGSTDLAGKNFYYRNHLDDDRPRGPWDPCPCCVGNIPRTLLMLPTWMYVKDSNSIYVNLFVGSTVRVENVAGTDVQMVQATDYPWHGKVGITVNPKKSRNFSVYVRVPNRGPSELYSETPSVSGLKSILLNGKPVEPVMAKGYAVITRKWKSGDTIEVEFPMEAQKIKANDKVAADRGRVALRYGPLIYNLESVDQKDDNVDRALSPDGALSTEWDSNLLDGVEVIKGTFTDGTPMMAVPNYARLNRGGRSIVWMKDGADKQE